MRSSIFKPFASSIAALLLAGCAAGPNYKRPVINAPTGFRGATNQVATNSVADLPWWSVFKDPVLQEAPSDGEYALYSKFDTTPKVTFALRQGEPLGFKPSTTGKVTAVAGGREKDFPDGNYVWKRR